MSGTIAGGYFKNKSYSCMYFNEDKYEYVSKDKRYYFQQGIEDDTGKPSMLIFSVDSDAMVFADDDFPSVEHLDRYIRWTIEDLDKMEKIRKYTGEEKISALSHEEKIILEDAVSSYLADRFPTGYISGGKSLDADTRQAMGGQLKELPVDWKSILSEVYSDIKEMSVREDLLDLIAKDGHDFLSGLNTYNLDEILTQAACTVSEHLNEADDYTYALETALADAHYAFMSIREQELEK